MSVFELCEMAAVSAFALASLCAVEAVRYAATQHVVEVWRDVSGRRRQSDLAERDQRYGQGSRQRKAFDAAMSDLSAQMQALTEIASVPLQDEIETKVAYGQKGDGRAWQG